MNMEETLSQAVAKVGFEVISTYTDAQAVEDGVLVDVTPLALPRTMFGGRRVTRVTRTIWTLANDPEFVDQAERVLTPMVEAALRAYDRGWYVGDWNGQRLWLIPNGGGYTLMVPEDY